MSIPVDSMAGELDAAAAEPRELFDDLLGQYALLARWDQAFDLVEQGPHERGLTPNRIQRTRAVRQPARL
ncbi:MAG TPA: hypothetical protein VM925_26825 [Labilithrix sp.]|nr:hypothetical protein [Labilithrix sp.]